MRWFDELIILKPCPFCNGAARVVGGANGTTGNNDINPALARQFPSYVVCNECWSTGQNPTNWNARTAFDTLLFHGFHNYTPCPFCASNDVEGVERLKPDKPVFEVDEVPTYSKVISYIHCKNCDATAQNKGQWQRRIKANKSIIRRRIKPVDRL